MTVDNCRVFDQGHTYPDINVGVHLHTHVYYKLFVKKGANNVMSLAVNTLKDRNDVLQNDIRGELNLVFNTCTGQNKNNNVQILLVYLAEVIDFRMITFVFLIVGHTKNSADHLFNCLRGIYHKGKIFTMEELLAKLHSSKEKTLHAATKDGFFDCETFFLNLYRYYEGKVKQNHIFSGE